jgi:arylsulfatase
MLEGRKGEKVKQAEKLTYELKRNIDIEYKRRAIRFMEEQAKSNRPFFLYYNHSLMHIPVVPRDEYKGKSGNGDWSDCLLELDGDFGELLDTINALGLRDNTIVVLAGDNGNEEMLLNRGTAGFFEGSYFTGMEASLRTPCIARWKPGGIHLLERREDVRCQMAEFQTSAGAAKVFHRPGSTVGQSACRQSGYRS